MGAGERHRRSIPAWVPEPVLDYLRHTRDGQSLRAIARDYACQPSTVLRRVRRIESRRDDPLVDSALQRLERESNFTSTDKVRTGGTDLMLNGHGNGAPDDERFEQEAARVLRRLAEQGACLALVPDMETAVVVRDTGEGGPTVRTAVVDRTIAEAMALKNWIASRSNGRILRYRITAAGRAALREIVARAENRNALGTGRSLADETTRSTDDAWGEPRQGRYALAESPLVALSRRRDKSGTPFLPDDLVAAGERLREDFELAKVEGHAVPDPDRLHSELAERTPDFEHRDPQGQSAALRLSEALAVLGPGLGDVTLRCCCYLEGLEAVEQRMGWSARSAKIVLRIALQQLKQYYDRHTERWSPLIG